MKIPTARCKYKRVAIYWVVFLSGYIGIRIILDLMSWGIIS